MSNLKRYFPFLILLIILVEIFFYWPRFAELKLASDALEYHNLAVNLLNGKGFYLEERGGLTMFREPGYPLFLFLNYNLFGIKPNLIRFEQAILLLAIIFLAYKLTLKIFKNEWLAKSAALLVALHPLFAIYSGELISEILAAFLIILFCYVWVKNAEQKSVAGIFGAGLILGYLILVKSIFIFLPFLIAPFFYLFKMEKRTMKLILFFSGIIILIAPWFYRNYFYFGKWGIAERSGIVMYVHVSKSELNREQFKNYAISSFLSQYFVRLRDSSFDFFNINVKPFNQMRKKMLEKGYSEGQVDGILSGESIKLWQKYPVKNFLIGFLELGKANAPTVPRNSIVFVYDVGGSPWQRFFKGGVIILIRLFWLIFLLVAFYGIWLAKNKPFVYPFILFIFYLNGLIFFLEGVPRFIFPIYSLYFIFFTFGIYYLLNKIWPAKFSKID